ncbi:MAG: hypothetical protein DME24_24220 [Verrucomicrobia bacterium]|nr:MAG: hypothetical protein DME24_24220 [Verrucomicrobiota bacterium]
MVEGDLRWRHRPTYREESQITSRTGVSPVSVIRMKKVEMSALIPFPRMFAVRQKFPPSPPLDIPATVQREFKSQNALSRIKSGPQIAVAVGSRGISNIKNIVAAVLDVLKAAGAKPFILPAMGSHGGATPEGQLGVLESYGITEQSMGVPIRASMEVERIGASADGVDVFCSVEAQRSDGIVLVNRVKPHTDFQGTLGSGVLKMCVIGLGKRAGAAACHAAATRLGYEHTLRSIARVVLRTAPIVCGVAIVENQFHSGAGMDPNVTGRWVHGYSSSLGPDNQAKPLIRRIFVRDLTPETHGNAIGIGFADITTTRLVGAMDKQVTYINALTSLTPNGAKIPIHFDTDRECISQALSSLAIPDTRQAKVVRIADTLSLVNLEVSEAYASLVKQRGGLEALGDPGEMRFDAMENLAP